MQIFVKMIFVKNVRQFVSCLSFRRRVAHNDVLRCERNKYVGTDYNIQKAAEGR